MERARITLLTVCGLEELDGHGERGVTHVLSILDPDCPDPASFAAYARPHRRTLLRFHDIVEEIPGQVAPQPADVDAILAFGAGLADDVDDRQEGHLLIHCHMGISRSTASMLMLLAQAYPDETADSLVARLVAIRPQSWPNGRMIGFADEALGLRGELSAAVSRLHLRQIGEKPHLVQTFRDLGRGREVEAALRLAA